MSSGEAVLHAMAHDAFVSYSSRDKPTADAVVATLERAGIRCWVAPRDVTPGDKWADAIVRAIEGGRLMVLVFSSDSNASQHIIREVELAAHHRLPVVPLRVEDVQPCPTLDYYIAGTHWLDAIDPPLEAHLERLAVVLRQLLAGPLAEGSTKTESDRGALGPMLVPPAPGPAAAVSRPGALPAAMDVPSSRQASGVTGLLAPPVPPAPPPGDRPGTMEPERQVRATGYGGRRWILVGAMIAGLVAVGVVVALWLTGGAGDQEAVAVSPSAPVVAPASPSVGEPSASVEPDVPRVGAPTDLRVLGLSASQVRLIWTRPGEGGKVVHFRVYRDGEAIGGKLDERTFTDEGVEPGTTYRYRVVAFGVDGSRASSEAVLVKVPAPPPPASGGAPSSGGNTPPACDGILLPSGECVPWD